LVWLFYSSLPSGRAKLSRQAVFFTRYGMAVIAVDGYIIPVACMVGISMIYRLRKFRD